MNTVYIVTHSYLLDGADETKFIGAYASENDARLAVRRKRRFPGFRDHPKGFHIGRLEIGRDQWSEGFITIPSEKKRVASSSRAKAGKKKEPNRTLQPTSLSRRG